MREQTIAQFIGAKKFPFYLYDSHRNLVYYEDADGYSIKYEYDSSENQVYYEASDGEIEDNRPKQESILTMDEIAEKFGIDVKTLKIKK